MSPEAFAIRCNEIVSTMRGHEAHRALDFLTNDVLRELGYGEGIAVFEAAVSRWHTEADAYPYTGPCPECRDSRYPREAPRRNGSVRRRGSAVPVRAIAQKAKP